MYSEYPALFTHSTQRTCTVSCIIYALYNVHIDSELYLVLYFIIYRMCVKINVLYVHCTLYSVHCTAYIVHCTAYIVQRTLYIVHCTMYVQHIYFVHCTAYISHILYVLALRNKYFIFLVIVYLCNCVFTVEGPTRYERISKITTRHTRNVCKCETKYR